MDRTCVINGCEKSIEPHHCVCAEHWKMLPTPLRQDLARAFNPYAADQDRGFMFALAAVHAWIIATFGGQGGKTHRSWEQLVRYVNERDAARARRAA